LISESYQFCKKFSSTIK